MGKVVCKEECPRMKCPLKKLRRAGRVGRKSWKGRAKEGGEN